MKSKEELLKGDPSDIAGEIRDAIASEGLTREQAGELIEYFMEKLNDKAQIIISQYLSREEREELIEKHIKEMRMFEKISGKDSLEYFLTKYEYAFSVDKFSKGREQEEGFRIMLGAELLCALKRDKIGFPETRQKRIEKPDWEMVEEYCENLRDGPVVDLVPALKTAYLGDIEPNNKKLEAYCISIMDILQNKVKETLKKKMEKQALEEFVNELLPSVFKLDTAGKSEKSFWRRFPLLDYFKENARGNEIISAAHSIVSLYRKFIGFSSDSQDEYEYSNDPFHFFDDAPILTDGNPDGPLPAEALAGSPEPVQGEEEKDELPPLYLRQLEEAGFIYKEGIRFRSRYDLEELVSKWYSQYKKGNPGKYKPEADQIVKWIFQKRLDPSTGKPKQFTLKTVRQVLKKNWPVRSIKSTE